MMKKIYFLTLVLACLTLTSFGQKKILFIGSGSAEEAAGDEVMVNRITALGFTVDTMKLTTFAGDDSFFPDNFRTEYDGFVISSSINSQHLKHGDNGHPDFHYINKPIICWEQGYYAKMGIGGGSQTALTLADQFEVQAGFESDPIIGTFTTGTAVFNADFSKGSLVNTDVLASGGKALIKVGTKPAIAIVDVGDSLNGDTIAPARRATWFGHSEFMDLITEDGKALFDRTLQWLMADVVISANNNLYSDIVIYANSNGIVFENSSIVDKVQVYGLNGQMYTSVDVYANSGQIDMKLPAGIYVVKAISGNTSYAEKVLIK